MLRCGTLLLLASLALAAPRDLRPRYGSGFAGFAKGTWVTMKITSVKPKRVPSVQTQTTRLIKADKTTLSLERVTKNPLTEDRTQAWTVPASGEAQAGEKAVVKNLPDEKVRAAGKQWDCTKRELTFTSKAGKRMVTEWVAKSPLLQIKRIERSFDAAGKQQSIRSVVLYKLPFRQRVSGRELECVTYRSLLKQGTIENREDSVQSRDIPGGFVSLDLKQYHGGKLAVTIEMKALRFGVK